MRFGQKKKKQVKKTVKLPVCLFLSTLKNENFITCIN
jgi:hypothetical protein